MLRDTLAFSDQLTLSNLSLIYRYATLSRALRISIRELLIIRNLSGLHDPFGNLGAVPNNTLLFIDAAENIKEAGLKIPHLNFKENGFDENEITKVVKHIYLSHKNSFNKFPFSV